ncbi:MAG: NAD(P)H-dependent oxidoreductase [Pseudomonadota bacterium]
MRTRIPVIFGSARHDGNTRALIDAAFDGAAIEIFDMSALNISGFDYAHENRDDDFLPLIEAIAARPVWVLASPVYWYAVSAPMKVFLDRLSDLTTIRKDLGRAIAGRRVFALSTSSAVEPPASFAAPLIDTCRYLDLDWGGHCHAGFERDRDVNAAAGKKARAFGDAVRAVRAAEPLRA